MVTYDEAKRLRNLRKHGFDFVGAEAIFAGFTITREDRREAFGELRLQTLGLWNGVVVFVVHTPRGDHDHLISIRKADKREERIYWKHHPG
ncbi:MAG: BrnT family toxin [Gammaproteobacteria bacterium]